VARWYGGWQYTAEPDKSCVVFVRQPRSRNGKVSFIVEMLASRASPAVVLAGLIHCVPTSSYTVVARECAVMHGIKDIWHR